MSRTTLQQIAISLDISVTTVSKALRAYPDVSKETIARVKKEAERLNYKPNAFAVNLRTQESKTIGLIIPEIVHQFFSSVVKGVIEEAEKHGYVVIILQTDQKMHIEKKRIEFLIEKQVDGILIALADETVSYEHLYEVKSLDLPLIMFDKVAKSVECSKVIIDDKKAGYMATKHLIDNGCKNIAHFRGPMMSQNSIDRFLGYKKALAEHHLIFKESNVYTCLKMSFEEGQENGKKMIEDKNDIDGVFVNTDLVAAGLITQLKKMNVRVPEEISVIGFSNWFLSSITTPSLSTIAQPSYSMGQLIFKLLLAEIKNRKNNRPVDFETVIMPTELIIRASTLAG